MSLQYMMRIAGVMGAASVLPIAKSLGGQGHKLTYLAYSTAAFTFSAMSATASSESDPPVGNSRARLTQTETDWQKPLAISVSCKCRTNSLSVMCPTTEISALIARV
jgi:hypothetical protein